jgi:hypothetical protein
MQRINGGITSRVHATFDHVPAVWQFPTPPFTACRQHRKLSNTTILLCTDGVTSVQCHHLCTGRARTRPHLILALRVVEACHRRAHNGGVARFTMLLLLTVALHIASLPLTH